MSFLGSLIGGIFRAGKAKIVTSMPQSRCIVQSSFHGDQGIFIRYMKNNIRREFVLLVQGRPRAVTLKEFCHSNYESTPMYFLCVKGPHSFAEQIRVQLPSSINIDEILENEYGYYSSYSSLFDLINDNKEYNKRCLRYINSVSFSDEVMPRDPDRPFEVGPLKSMSINGQSDFYIEAIRYYPFK